MMGDSGISFFSQGRAWHYTNADGLMGILENHHIWASAPQVLNDLSEVQYGAGIVRAALRELIEKDLLGEPYGAYLAQVVGDDWVDIMQSRIFVASASREPDLLGQWRNYANTDGFALGFELDGKWGSRTVMREGVPTLLTPLLSGWFNVVYNTDEQYMIARNALLFSAKAPPATALKDWGSRPETWADLASHTRLLLSTVPMTMKHPAFADEREVRYIGGATNDQVHFRSTSGRVVPFTKVGRLGATRGPGINESDAPFPVFEIICGPSCRPGTIQIAKRLLASQGIENIEVRQSEIPFVG